MISQATADYLGNDYFVGWLPTYCLARAREEQTRRVEVGLRNDTKGYIQLETRLICDKRDHITQPHSHLVRLLSVRRPLDILNRQSS